MSNVIFNVIQIYMVRHFERQTTVPRKEEYTNDTYNNTVKPG